MYRTRKLLKAVTVAAIVAGTSARPAIALDETEQAYAFLATSILMVSLMCPGYVPLPDVLRFVGRQKVGTERADQIMQAVGARITFLVRRGGGKDVDGSNAGAMIPEISLITDGAVSGFIKLYDADAERACHEVGNSAVAHGVAEKAKN